MKKSIKWRLTITFIIVIVCCIGSILLFNTIFLEKLYVNRKKGVIKQSYYALENGITEAYDMGYTLSDLFRLRKSTISGNNESNLSRFLRELQEIYGVIVILMDSNNKTYSLFQNNSRFERRIKDYIYKDVVSGDGIEILEKTDLYTIVVTKPTGKSNSDNTKSNDAGPTEFYESSGPSQSDNKSNQSRRPVISDFANRGSDIECFGFLSDNKTAFFITIPVESIKEPIELFNKSLIVVSFVIILIGSIAIFVISNNLAKPLLELSEISKKMSRLEFENKYDGKREDEIGILGNTMNDLSEKLEKNIGELKNANLKLKEDLQQREQLDLMRQEFVANVSHELKTPIALIQGYAEGLETEGIADSAENREYYVSVIKDEANNMNTLVHQLLDLSAIERGASDIDIARINLKEIIDGIIENYKLNLTDNGIKPELKIDDNIYVWADGYKLEEVVKNYLSNAIHHVDDHKKVLLAADCIENDKVRFYVFNSGIQLPDDEREKIWEKFYKVDKAHTRSYGGTGLGLSIVKAIAEQHGSTCGCENCSVDGIDGMKFYFDFSAK